MKALTYETRNMYCYFCNIYEIKKEYIYFYASFFMSCARCKILLPWSLIEQYDSLQGMVLWTKGKTRRKESIILYPKQRNLAMTSTVQNGLFSEVEFVGKSSEHWTPDRCYWWKDKFQHFIWKKTRQCGEIVLSEAGNLLEIVLSEARNLFKVLQIRLSKAVVTQ